MLYSPVARFSFDSPSIFQQCLEPCSDNVPAPAKHEKAIPCSCSSFASGDTQHYIRSRIRVLPVSSTFSMPLRRCLCSVCVGQNPQGVDLPAPTYRAHQRSSATGLPEAPHRISPLEENEDLVVLKQWSYTLQQNFEDKRARPSTAGLIWRKDGLDPASLENEEINKHLASLTFLIRDVSNFDHKGVPAIYKLQKRILQRAQACQRSLDSQLRKTYKTWRRRIAGRKGHMPTYIETSELPRPR